ncbi:MAG: VWA domain-containing protein [Lachnospiraceae bacterium]|nr:VWA domain-containing protein [Lachnospiraceae bacterium]
MIFESLWPLFFLAAVPVIIILYLLKPRGEDQLISSNLLWQKLLRNEQSKTFFEKFVHNILMYLQILIIALLVVALMSPFIRIEGQSGGRKILLFDTSGSMQHVTGSGKTRLEEAVAQACDYVRTAENTRFSIVTEDALGTKILAVDMADADSLIRTMQDIKCSDSGGDLISAQGILDTLMGDDAENAADLIVYTDGGGASEFEELHSSAEKELRVVGEVSSNVANEYTVFTEREDGSYDVMVSMVNYSDSKVTFDVSLYNEEEKLISLEQMHLAPSESTFCLFEQIDWQGQTLKSCIDGITFDGGARDSLKEDNVSEAVKSQKNQVNGLLVGEGNTFIEKAYLAVTGESIAKSDTDAIDDYNVVIYDAGQTPGARGKNRLLFGDAGKESIQTLRNVVLDMKDCDLTAGLSGFTIGVNTAYLFALPEGAESFLEYNGKCAGYYREQDGIKEVVVGFDLRESDFPLRAEFPVFLANAMVYLTDTSFLASNVYYAGEEITLQPWAEPDELLFDSRPGKAGLYQVGNGEHQETYVVRFQTATESDGRAIADSVGNTENIKLQKVKQTVRNLFLLLALMFLIVEWIVYVRQMRYRGKFYLFVRGAVALCVALALLGIQVHLGSSRIATVFVVDLSDSNEEHLEECEKYLQSVITKMPAGNVYGIVTFGKNALVEQFLTEESYYGGLMTLPEKTATNFEEAISKALTLIPGDYSGRLVVLTDGKETRGDIAHMGQALLASRVEFLTLLYEDEETPDAYIENVSLPSYLHPGDKYTITVQVESNYDTDAVITLYNGSAMTASNSVHLNRGSNRYVFSAQVDADADSGAMENLMVQVQATGDTCPENDSFSAYSVVEASPKVLLISGRGADVSEFDSVLQATGCDYHVVSALNAPDDLNDMLAYKSIILADVYIDDLADGFLENLDTYVKDYGCGFICCGGEDSFALGGYKDTVLERVLPVDMQPRNMNEIPSMAMVMVIDHSGSMIDISTDSGISELDIAIKAATVAVDNLRDSDYVGVLTFDDQYDWQVELRAADDKTAIKDEIKQISEGGGTTIKPALLEACEVISESDASIKHVVLLTDGMGETDNFQDVINAYTAEGITLSTVAVGSDSDMHLLEKLADRCGGRYYYSDLSSDIPRIFAREVFLGSDSYIQNGVFSLKVQKSHELTNHLFASGWPVLYGYIAATPKTASIPVIVSEGKENPILTVWQYGLGRTAAWNSDVTGEWSGAFAGEDDYVQMWKRIVDYTTGNADMGEDRVDVMTVGEQTEITYQTDDYEGSTEILVTIVDPKGEHTEEKLHAVAPGKYTAELSTPQTGLYYFNIRRSEDGEIQSYLTTAAAVQFSDEYKFDASTDSYLKFVEQYGKIITEQEPVFIQLSTGARESYSLTNWLLFLAICLFVADVAMRRFQLAPKRFRGRSKKREKTVENALQDTSNEGMSEKASSKNLEKKKRETGKSKKAERLEQTLDTSQLLKKKDDRKI